MVGGSIRFARSRKPAASAISRKRCSAISIVSNETCSGTASRSSGLSRRKGGSDDGSGIVAMRPHQKIELRFVTHDCKVRLHDRLHLLVGVVAERRVVDQLHHRSKTAAEHLAKHATPQFPLSGRAVLAAPRP